jgi:hypothetical protein
MESCVEEYERKLLRVNADERDEKADAHRVVEAKIIVVVMIADGMCIF